MKISIKSIKIKNFKSYVNETLHLSSLNVIVGPNGSGKTNLLEGIKLVFDCLSYSSPIDNPFIPFWGYLNAVYKSDETRQIEFTINLSVDRYDITYDFAVTGADGSFKFFYERLEIRDFLEIKHEGSNLLIKYDVNYLNRLKKNKTFNEMIQLPFFPPSSSVNPGQTLTIETENEFTLGKAEGSRSIFSFHKTNGLVFNLVEEREGFGILFFSPSYPEPVRDGQVVIPLVTPIVQRIDERSERSSFEPLINLLFKTFGGAYSKIPGSSPGTTSNMVFIKHSLIYALKKPVPLTYSSEGTFTGESTILWLFRYFNKSGKLPDRLQRAIQDLFPGCNLSFKLTEDGTVMLQFTEQDEFGNKNVILPPSMPDGLLKVILIISAIEMKPMLIMIDELENSLHDRLIEYVINSIRDSNISAIVTTHSPLVVNYANLDELRLIEKRNESSHIMEISKPDQVKEKLIEQGITPGDLWLYGELS